MGQDSEQCVTVTIPVDSVTTVVGSLRSSAHRARVQAERYRAEAAEESDPGIAEGLREDAGYCDRTAERLEVAAGTFDAARFAALARVAV